jgi:hypothetical protein
MPVKNINTYYNWKHVQQALICILLLEDSGFMARCSDAGVLPTKRKRQEVLKPKKYEGDNSVVEAFYGSIQITCVILEVTSKTYTWRRL